MKSRTLLAACVVWWATSAVAAPDSSAWAGYLDYAYVFTSAEPEALRARLAQYGKETGVRFEDYLNDRSSDRSYRGEEDEIRRLAIAQLIQYLSTGEPDSLDDSVDTIRMLEARLSRHENRYWYHYILAHQALETGRRFDFVGELLELWLRVVVPLETPFEMLQTLSLSDSPNSGFVSALPYVYENVARIILIRGQRMGIDRDLDPLGGIVRVLHDGRVGSNPDVIPVALSSRDYLDRIATRLDGSESDAGSLTFTLALWNASRYHDEARALLAEQGFSADTIKAMKVTSGAYEAALNRAHTYQGQCAVYTRVLRQLGEVYAAKQRLGQDPEIETPFSIEGAIEVYNDLHRAGRGDTLAEHGYDDRESWVHAMHGLWEEIQETSLNAADYYLTRSVEQPARAQQYARTAAGVYARYLGFFHKFASAEGREAVPDSAYFAAYEAARGYGDALFTYAPQTIAPAELELATRRYVGALRLFPFDPKLWMALTAALERQGRESDYLTLARPVAEAVTRSRHVDTWIDNEEPGAARIATIRRALSDSQVLVYLGFAEEGGIAELEATVAELRVRRDQVEQQLLDLAHGNGGPASPAFDAAGADDPVARQMAGRDLADAQRQLDRLEKQIGARTRALPVYKATLLEDGLADELRAQRNHPVHTLLRRMYYEHRS